MFYLKIIFIILLVIAIIFSVYQIFVAVQKAHTTQYYKQDDVEAQKLYDVKKNINVVPEISLKDKFNLSTKFIYDITAKVIRFFTKEDKEKLRQIGKLLVNLGMRYNHVLKYSITKEQITRASKIGTKTHNKTYSETGMSK